MRTIPSFARSEELILLILDSFRGEEGKGKNYKTKPRESDLMVKLQRVYARMTWLDEAMKDGVSTDMFRVAANRL